MYIVTIQQGDEIPLLVYCVSPKGADVKGAWNEVPRRLFGALPSRVTGGDERGAWDEIHCWIDVPNYAEPSW